tara:strand:- start:721 stop:1032 length:312 start_codon:yes stop_codon:yes gene_type:complete
MQNVWYILIHVSLGLIGWQVFTFTNIGVLAAIAVCGGVQIWPMYELHRLTWPKFETLRARQTSSEARRRETRGYLMRMGRLYFFRTTVYALLTLFVAWLMRTA